MNKPTKPNITIPENFARNGVKTDFSDSKLENGFDPINPDVLSGDNLNKLIDDTYQGLNYSISTSDVINSIDEHKFLSVHNGNYINMPMSALNAILSGEIIENSLIYDCISGYKRSTFDLSKFEVVGTPTISDDGVVSGINSTNYLGNIPITYTAGQTFSVDFEYTPTGININNTEILFAVSGANSSRPAYIARYQDSSIAFSIGSNTRSQVYILDINESYKLQYSTDCLTYCNLIINGVVYDLPITTPLDGDNLSWISVAFLKNNAEARLFNGNSNLKQFSITVDGKEVFSGNKTGLDVIKPDNYEVVGNPTITDDGVASGFSSTNYLISADKINITKTTVLNIIGKFKTGNIDTLQSLFELCNSTGIDATSAKVTLRFNSNGDLNGFITNANTQIATLYSKDIKLQANTEYDFSFSINGLSFEIRIGDFPTFSGTLSDYLVEDLYVVSIGCRYYIKNYWVGSIDLNAFKIYVDGNLVYQPCLKIPYTESKTGSKIVDVAYRDRVIDLYEQEGQAGYYTIDEENQNFTLPMGEVYGMIESKADKDMLNNPYSLFDSKYSDHELNNLSWLKSEGQWNAKTVYPTAYDKLLKVYNGTETVEGLSVKLSTEEYTDYDFVLNTADETFRLPLLDGSEDLVSNKYIGLELLASGSTYTAPANGWYYFNKRTGVSNAYISIHSQGSSLQDAKNSSDASLTVIKSIQKGAVATVSYNATGTTQAFRFLYARGNGSLYFYVGETVQNANLIDAGRIGEQLAGKADLDAQNLSAAGKSLISGLSMPSDKYIDLTLGASGSEYTAPANGWYCLSKTATAADQFISLQNTTSLISVGGDKSLNSGVVHAYMLPARKGDIIKVGYNFGGTTNKFKFIYAEGAKEDN